MLVKREAKKGIDGQTWVETGDCWSNRGQYSRLLVKQGMKRGLLVKQWLKQGIAGQKRGCKQGIVGQSGDGTGVCWSNRG